MWGLVSRKKGNRRKRRRGSDRRRRNHKAKAFEEVGALNGENLSHLGFDYGVLPRVGCVFDPEFLQLWNQARPIAMMYTFIPQIGVRTNVPLVGIAFEEYEVGKKLFELFKSWMKPPCDESAVDVYLIADESVKEYHLHVGINQEQLLLRTFGPGAERDYINVSVVAGIRKTFPLSRFFRAFRQMAEGREILVCPMRVSPKLEAANGSSMALEADATKIEYHAGFVKSDVQFLNKETMKRDTLAYFLSELEDGKEVSQKTVPELPIPSPKEVAALRERQLKRFFPVSIARLPHNESFTRTRETLLEEYAEWQIIQGACNLLAKRNWPECGCGEKVDMIRVYQELRNSCQSAIEDVTLTLEFDSWEIEEQIKEDIKYLCSSVLQTCKGESIEDLKTKGYI